MKTTVLVNVEQKLVAMPSMDPLRPVRIEAHGELGSITLQLTMDQVGAFLFGVEQAAEAAEIQQQRAAAGVRAADPQPTGQE